jgi:hypothetical protein
VLNVLTFIAATVYGVGMIVVATFRARKGPREPVHRDAGNGDTGKPDAGKADAGSGRPEPSATS